MKVILLGESYYPDEGAGEGYLGELASNLRDTGMDILIVATGKIDGKYIHNDLPVQRLSLEPITPSEDVSVFYKGNTLSYTKKFAAILDDQRPDVVHAHVRSHEISHLLLDEVKRRNIPLVFTYHIAKISCLRGDLMRWSKEICDGVLDVNFCSRCFSHKRGLPRPFSDLISLIPPGVSKKIRSLRLSGRLWTALRMRELVSLFRDSVYRFLSQADRIVVLSKWSMELLVRNGVKEERIFYSPIGLFHQSGRVENKTADNAFNRSSSHRIRCVFLGRFDRPKGIDVLIQAVQQVPDLPIELHLFSAEFEELENSYVGLIEKMVKGDARIKIFNVIPNNNVVQHLHNYDLLAVPSRILETGPFVVIEAFAAGIPVIGSKIGGIAELVKDGVNGLLVEPGSVRAWSAALKRIYDEKGLLAQLRAGINPPRSMKHIAGEMTALYESLVKNRA